MSRARQKEKKAKRRKERLRQLKHLQHLQHYASDSPVESEEYWAEDDGEDDEMEEVEADPIEMPSRLKMERSLRALHRVIEKQRFSSADEANRFLEKLGPDGLKNLERQLQEDPKERAQELAYQAQEARSIFEAASLAKRALELDPLNVDALVSKAVTTARNDEEQLTLIQEAVRAGEQALGGPAFFDENKGRFWRIIDTRPYMRTRMDLAVLLLEMQRTGEAITHLNALLDLNPNDNQGVRDTLLGALLSQGDREGAKRLLDRYKGDGSAIFRWGETLERFLAGDFAGAERALEKARKHNPHVEDLLLGRRKPPREKPDYYSFGDEREAARVYFELVGQAWRGNRDALSWLKELNRPKWAKEK